MPCSAVHTVPEATAERLGQLYVNYNDRICPLQTFALDFTRKLTGKRNYRDSEGKSYTAEQLLANFIFFGEEWEQEPVIRIKGGPLKSARQLPDNCSFASFFTTGDYVLGPYVQEAMQGNRDKFHQDVMKIDDKLMIITSLRQGNSLRVFPVTQTADNQGHASETTMWYAPTDPLPDDIEDGRKSFIQNVFSLLHEYAQSGDWDKVDETLSKMLKYQQRDGASTIPSDTQVWAERLYNRIPFATILFMISLTFGFLGFIGHIVKGRERLASRISLTVTALTFLSLTCCMAQRWIISGNIPMANGYETMLTMAWFVLLIALLTHRRFPIILSFGLLLAGFFLLVSHISQMDPQIGHLMPVLASPLLTIHVSIIMMAYALLSLTFLCGIWGLILCNISPDDRRPLVLSELLLRPALACLGLGIFIGAIWANISWGTYWSWDPKETWALITFMVYAIPVHRQRIAWLRHARHHHLFMVLAFLTLLMTYFGVNYFLGGMHSYA